MNFALLWNHFLHSQNKKLQKLQRNTCVIYFNGVNLANIR
jgi:hypothetical protein